MRQQDSLDSKEIKPVNPKGNQPWIFIGRTDAEAEDPVHWPLNMKSWCIGKYPEAEKYWGEQEKRATENEMIVWHHRLNGHKFDQTLGDSEEQGSLACCSQRGRKDLDTLIHWRTTVLGLPPSSDARVPDSPYSQCLPVWMCLKPLNSSHLNSGSQISCCDLHLRSFLHLSASHIPSAL